jgi:hypothetical protein
VVHTEFKVPFKQAAYPKAQKSRDAVIRKQGQNCPIFRLSSRGSGKIDSAFVENPLVAADFDQAARVARLLR